MKPNALIIANGTMPGAAIARRLSRTASLIVCADGGANHARKLGITPDIILGDLDSIASATRKAFRTVPTMFINDQERTDLQKAIRFCIAGRITSVDVIGGTGDRIDHSTGALGCFKEFGREIDIRFVDGMGTLFRIDGRVRLKIKRKALLSLIPLDRCTGVTTTGLKHSLKNSVLELGVREGTSNVATASFVTISVRRGTLLCFTFHRQ